MAPTVPASPFPRHRTVSCERGQHISAPVRFEKRVLVVSAAGRQPDLARMPASRRHYHAAPAPAFDSVSAQAQGAVLQGLMGQRRTVGAMDGAIEPPWMGSRRVLR
ncbi:hypothetical protein D7Y42_12690 [Stenotrophomonas maltophilia]|nr:hypothetical protein [Stenotrophomonas maltophilia]MBA0294648.1 hypothetical protein [Stenotrophomonas maltophilia]MBA0349354.1 hypothetical protein [Stenotrophomonas maltophilia]MBA0371551.1 hypothetical protein [Stenotrophomonas maltophilia]MBA0377393.1 hypothetical protein [Stenotrophomonas maltophilia]